MAKFKTMRKLIFLGSLFVLVASCNQSKDTRGIPGPAEVEARKPDPIRDLEREAAALQEQGYQTFLYGEGEERQLMQEYYIVFLKKGENRQQDSLAAAKLQQEHLAHLERMASEGYLSMAGPFGDEGEIRGVAIYNTPSLEMADSLARLDPMVAAGRLKLEIHKWWAAKGSGLK
jgi:uncharacterized protein YciI